MLNPFLPIDVLNPKALAPSVHHEVPGSEVICTYYWEHPSAAVETESLRVYRVPLLYGAAPFTDHLDNFSRAFDGAMEISLAGYIRQMGRTVDPELNLLLSSYNRCEVNDGYAKLWNHLTPDALLSPVVAIQGIEYLKIRIVQVDKQYPSHQWNSIFHNLFDRLRMLEIHIRGYSTISYDRQYFERELIYSDFNEDVKQLDTALSQLTADDKGHYNDLFRKLILL